ncbi:hypothetical protein ACLOJK_039569 [Asimina triloba]
MDSEPPFQNVYKALFDDFRAEEDRRAEKFVAVDEASDLPLIDLALLTLSDQEREDCKRQIVDASMEWGFFQVKNHGVSREILDAIRREQLKLFRQPFEDKAAAKVLDFFPDCYRWGTPTATNLGQFSWSEAFHVPLVRPHAASDLGEFGMLRSVTSSVLAYPDHHFNSPSNPYRSSVSRCVNSHPCTHCRLLITVAGEGKRAEGIIRE